MEHPTIHNKLSWEKINAFPIKNKNMSIRELRQLCVDFFRFNKTVLWTPNKPYTFIKSSKTMNTDTLTPGTVYAGYPYAMGTGNCYRLMDYLDPETGVLKIRLAAKCFRLFASQCSIGAYWGWSRVINSADYCWTYDLTEKNGFIALGPYTYDKSVDEITPAYNTIMICEANGKETMFASYAQLKLADGLMYMTSAGHVVMASCDAVVVKNADGSINGQESYVTILDQTNKWTEYENAEGDKATIKANVDAKWTFDYLYEKHYIPFTFAEFLGTHPIEDTICEFSHKGDTITKEQLFDSFVTCNYGIVDTYIIVKNPEGNQVYKHAVRCIRPGLKKMELMEYENDGEMNLNGRTDRVSRFGTPNFTPGHSVEIVVQVATGERITVYQGKIAPTKAPAIKEKLTREAIDRVPIKNKNLTVTQLRQLCVAFFRFNKTVLWTPDDSIEFYRTRNGAFDCITQGNIYAGYPYSMGTGNCYRILDYMDENGVVDIKKLSRVFRFIASQCSIGAYWGWGRVISSARYDWTCNMTHRRGFLRLGEYTYDDEKCDSFGADYDTSHICAENGEQVMYRSYAKLEAGDGLVYFVKAGHVVMASDNAHVRYNPDGTIDGENSYIHIIEQASTWQPYENEKGDKYLMKDSVDTKWSFKFLFDTTYIPFTFAEFHGRPVEDTVCTIDLSGDVVTEEQLFSAHVKSNFGIADMYAFVKNEEGEVIYKHAVRALRAGEKDLLFDRVGETDMVGVNGPVFSVDTWGEYPAAGTYGLTVEVQLATGERPVVYTGKLEIDA